MLFESSKEKLRRFLFYIAFLFFVGVLYNFLHLAGIVHERNIIAPNDSVTTTMIVGVDTESLSDVVFVDSTEEIKEIEYGGKKYFGYVVKKEYPEFSQFSSKIINNISNHSIFNGVSVSENVGIATIKYDFSALISEFNTALSSDVSLAVFEITMPGKNIESNIGTLVNDTLSVDLLSNQGEIMELHSVQESPYAFYYQFLFVCSVCLCLSVLFLVILDVNLRARS